MSALSVSVQGISKCYQLGEAVGARNLRDLLSTAGRRRAASAVERNRFWALRDISFDVREGDVVGIIGRNGAGKSTLLKVLSRITEPTSGQIVTWGRVSSLLEVGTGFHPELTGRENVFLNGVILGMSRQEVRSRFDEIVAFAGVEKFVDTPVKRYSSGMRVRLAFAVAAHLESEILIVDEVLAVGDADFQRKSLGKMEDIASKGRTVIFVSHNMGTMRKLCSKGVLLEGGCVSDVGSIEKIADRYVGSLEAFQTHRDFSGRYLLGLRSVSEDGAMCQRFKQDLPVHLDIDLALPPDVPRCSLTLGVFSAASMVKVFTNRWQVPTSLEQKPKCRARISIPGDRLTPGDYLVNIAINGPEGPALEFCQHALAFSIVDIRGEHDYARSGDIGVAIIRCDWRLVDGP